jgi:polysaccharide biosynthesis/export protein
VNKDMKWNLNRRCIKFVLSLYFIHTLSGCGIVYKSSIVNDDGSGNIRVVILTPDTVLEANNSPYEPLQLPNVFSQDAISDTHFQNSTNLPNQIHNSQKISNSIVNHLPEPLQPQPYLIGVGDVVMLSTPEAANVVEALNGILATQNRRQGYTIQDDGTVSIPDIGRFLIGGLTLQEAEDTVFRQLVDAGVAPSFSIEIVEFNSQRVYVSGAVKSPGIEPIALQPLYLDEAISRKGGVTVNDASFLVIRLYRNGSTYQLSGLELKNQNGSGRILLRDGDRIEVDMTDHYDNILGLRQQARENAAWERKLEMEARRDGANSILSRLQYGAIDREFVYIIGEVLVQKRYTLPFENTAVLADALLEGGGVSSSYGNPEQIYVLRRGADQKNSETITALHLDATNAANFLLATRLELRPNDVVFVGTQPITNWNRIINQIIPTLIIPDINK